MLRTCVVLSDGKRLVCFKNKNLSSTTNWRRMGLRNWHLERKTESGPGKQQFKETVVTGGKLRVFQKGLVTENETFLFLRKYKKYSCVEGFGPAPKNSHITIFLCLYENKLGLLEPKG